MFRGYLRSVSDLCTTASIIGFSGENDNEGERYLMRSLRIGINKIVHFQIEVLGTLVIPSLRIWEFQNLELFKRGSSEI